MTKPLTDEQIKAYTNRARMVLDYIEEERARCTALIMAIDDRDFLLYCVCQCYTVSEIARARQLFGEGHRSTEVLRDDIEDLM
jgi:hypothetical protein